MGWTKRQIVEDAYAELALANYDFDLSPEEEQFALRKLDTMMAEWSAIDINLGYAFGLTPTDTDLDQDSGLPLFAISSVYLKLAINILSSKGKATPPATVLNALAAYDAMLARVALMQVRRQQLPNTLPRGAGSKPWRTNNRPFMPTPDLSPTRDTPDGQIDFGD